MVKFLLHHPIAVIITTLSLVVLSLISFHQIPVSLLPDIPIPEITVQVSYAGASARELQKAIIRPLSNQLQQVTHLSDIKVQTQDGLSVIKLAFDYGTDINLAYIEANEKIDGIIGSLPKDLPRPKVIKAGAGDIPVFNLNIVPRSESTSFLEVSEFCENVLKRRIEQLPEVALVDMSGLAQPEVVIYPDRKKLLGLGISDQMLTQILQQNNIELGNLTVKDGLYQYNIRLGSALRTPADIQAIVFRSPTTDRILQFKDFVNIQVKEQKIKGLYLFNGRRAVVLSIIKQSDTQLLSLKEEFNKLTDSFKKDYPDLNFYISQDQTELLDASISNLVSNLITGGLCAFVIIFLFLGNFKSPVLIGITIPVSLIITFLFFYLFHISINIVSLAGLVLGIGMVVDSSIIVIENIEQFRANGESLEDACIKGTNEVMLPLFTSILTNSAVFVPLIFLSGIAGALFFDQAVSVSLALGISLLASFTLIPVLYYLFYYNQERKIGYRQTKESILMRWIEKWYDRLMYLVFKFKVGMLLIFTVLVGLAVYLFLHLEKKGMPDITHTELQAKIDWGEPVTIMENTKRIHHLLTLMNTKFQYVTAFVGQQQFLLNRELQQNFNETSLYLKVQNNDQFIDLTQRIDKFLKVEYPYAVVQTQPAQNIFEKIFQSDQTALQAHIVSNRKNDVPGFSVIDTIHRKLASNDMKVNVPSLQNRVYIRIFNEKLLLYDIKYEDLYDVLKTVFNENKIDNLKAEQKYIPIVIGSENSNIKDLITVAEVTNSKGLSIPVSSLIEMRSEVDYKSFFSGREGSFIPLDFFVSNEQVEETRETVRNLVHTQSGLSVNFSGSFYKNLAFVNELIAVILVAIALLFFILSAQFESLLQPFIVMLAVIFGLTGSMFILYLTGGSLNIMSIIGMVVLIGIVDNDSILKIDTMNKSRSTMSLMDSITLAGKRRLKAQLMTSVTTILGLVPTLFAGGLGNELQKPLALSVIGGMVSGVIVSITFIPLVYWFIYSRGDTKKRLTMNLSETD
jgi:multidrug efflux pump subunit AcrB